MKIIKLIFLLLTLLVNGNIYADILFAINGVDNGEVENNIIVYVNDLSQPKDANNHGFLKQVQNSAQQAANALGFYQMQLNINVSGEIDKQTVTLNVELGMPTRITELNLKLIGEGNSDPAFLKTLENFPLKHNDTLHHGKYEEGKSQLKNFAQRHGYFDSKFEKETVEVTSQNNSAAATIWFNTGIRYQFGELSFANDLPADKFIYALQNFQAGEPYDSRLLTKFNAEVNDTGYFKNISILPEFQKKQGRQIPILVVATMRPKDSFNAGIGVSTDEGVRGKFRWTRPWVNQYGHSITGNLVASIPEQEASIVYNIPIEDPLYHYYSIQSGYKLVNKNDTDTTQYLFGVGRNKRLENDWLRSIFVRFDKEYGVQGQQDFSTELILPGISFSRSRVRGGINATWGDSQQYLLEASNEIWYSSADLLKAYGRVKILRTYNEHQFTSITELGAIYTDSIYDIPSSMRYFTGGDQSIRGYGYESISPKDEQNFLIGGKYLAVQSIEYRFPIRPNWKLATFVDAGTATSTFNEPISVGSGIGVVWSSPVGPIRIYFAVPINNPDQALDKWKVHFMIGPEL